MAVELVDITHDRELFIKTRRYVQTEWGTHLSFDDYLTLETELAATLNKHDLGFRVFALIDDNEASTDTSAAISENETDQLTDEHGRKEENTDSNEKSPTIIGSCDIITRPLYCGFETYALDNCIGKVYVRPEFRKQGHGNRLLTEITSLFNTKFNRVCLWSDIGDYYSRFGYQFPVQLPGESFLNRWTITNPEKSPSECDALDANITLSQIVNEHQRLMLRLTDTVQFDLGDRISLTHVVPHQGLYDRLITRSKFTAEKLGLKNPEYFAARTPDDHGWLTWSYFFEEKKAAILGAYGSANEIGALMVVATNCAAELGCSIELWESSLINIETNSDEIVSAMDAHKLHVEPIKHEEAIPMSVGSDIWLRPGFYCWS